MQNSNLLPIAESLESEIIQMASRFRGYTGISIDILSVEDNRIRVRVEQKENRNGFILTQSQLVARAATVLSPLENKFQIEWVPLTFRPAFDEIDNEWIKARMIDLKLKNKDISKQLAIDESTISQLIGGRRTLTKFQKAAFFYYFLTFELNRDFRAQAE